MHLKHQPAHYHAAVAPDIVTRKALRYIAKANPITEQKMNTMTTAYQLMENSYNSHTAGEQEHFAARLQDNTEHYMKGIKWACRRCAEPATSWCKECQRT